MSVVVIGLVITNRGGNLTQIESHLLIILGNHGNNAGRGIWPSYNTIAQEMKCHRTTVISTMTSLIKKDYVCKRSRSSQNKSLSNQYYINVKKLMAESCQSPQGLDDEFDPFEPTTGPNGVVAQDYHPSSAGLPPQSPTTTTLVAQDYPKRKLTVNETSKQTHARAPASLNTKEIEQAQPAAEEKKEAESYLNSLREVAEKKEARMAPKEEANFGSPFVLEENPLLPVAPNDRALEKGLRDAGITDANIRAVLRIYPDRRQVNQALERLAKAMQKGDVRNVNALFMTIVKDPYQEPVKSRVEQEKEARASREAEERRKLMDECEARERIKESLVSNPGKVQRNMSSLRSALRDSLREARQKQMAS